MDLRDSILLFLVANLVIDWINFGTAKQKIAALEKAVAELKSGRSEVDDAAT